MNINYTAIYTVIVNITVSCFLGQPILAAEKKHNIVISKKQTTNTGVSKLKLAPSQKTALLSALKSLRKLQTATEVGLSLDAYRTRLIDAKADIEENLIGVPNCEAKKHITRALDAYQDASVAWADCLENGGDWEILRQGETGRIVKKYKLDEGNKPQWNWNIEGTTGLSEDALREIASRAIPSSIWGIASDLVKQSETITKSTIVEKK